MFQPDPFPLLPRLADQLGAFFVSDTCEALRAIAKSRIADALISIGATVTSPENAVTFLQSNAVNAQTQESISAISQISIFLAVLDKIERDLHDIENLTVTKKITVE
jgi:hypothetical protein